MFQKNLEAVRIKNPALAAKLEKIDISSIKSIGVFEAENQELILSYNDTPLHNTSDPVREARTTWNKTVSTELKKHDIAVVFGLGLGYLFKRTYISTTSKIFLLEPFIDVLRFVLEHVDLSNEISDERVFVADNPDDLLNKIEDEYLQGDRIEYLFLNSYAVLAQEMLFNLSRRTLEICEAKGVDQNTIINQSKIWTKNSLLNLPHFQEMRPVGHLDGKFSGKPALIISAGPSLIDNLEMIKQNKDKFLTIAVGQAYKTLVDAGITPDFVTFADSEYLNIQVHGVEDTLSNVNLVMASRADSYLLQREYKNKLLSFSINDNIAKWFSTFAGENIGLHKSGGTVAIKSYFLAKAFGCNPIAFTGLDLAFVNNKMYSDGSEVKTDAEGNIVFWYGCSPVPKKLAYVKDRNGNQIPTRDDYVVFIRHFESILSEGINLTRVINTSTSGAYIKGMQYMEFDEFVGSLQSQSINVDEAITEIFAATEDTWVSSVNKAVHDLVRIKEEIQILDCRAKKVYQILEEICQQMENQPINDVTDRIESIKEDMANTRSIIMNNPFLMNYLQTELLSYVKSYSTYSLFPTPEEIRNNITLDRDLFKLICWATENVSTWMETAISQYKSKKVPAGR